MMTRGEGAEVITDVSASGSFDSDTLIFTKAVYSGDVWMARNGDDLLITINADGGSVLITG